MQKSTRKASVSGIGISHIHILTIICYNTAAKASADNTTILMAYLSLFEICIKAII